MEKKTPWYTERVNRREFLLVIACILTCLLTFVLFSKLGIIGFIARLPFGDVFSMATGVLLWTIIALVFNKLIGKK